MEVLSHHSSIS